MTDAGHLPTVDAGTASWTQYTTRDVAVGGGVLRVGVWEPPGAPGPVATVLAVHGITANHRSWALLARALPGLRIVAPDLRGRGRSNALPGPYGMAAHADDLAEVLGAVGGGPAVVVGHSMGAFVTLVTADRHPDLVRSVVLVDGGLPLVTPDAEDPDEVIQAVLGPAAERLRMTFPDRPAYSEFWQKHPAFARGWTEAVAEYVDYDLDGSEPHLRPSTTYDAMAADSRDIIVGGALRAAIERLRHPARLLVAERGMLDQVPPLYPDEALEPWRQALPDLRITRVSGVNHYTITLHERGADQVARAVRDVLGQERPAASARPC